MNKTMKLTSNQPVIMPSPYPELFSDMEVTPNVPIGTTITMISQSKDPNGATWYTSEDDSILPWSEEWCEEVTDELPQEIKDMLITLGESFGIADAEDVVNAVWADEEGLGSYISDVLEDTLSTGDWVLIGDNPESTDSVHFSHDDMQHLCGTIQQIAEKSVGGNWHISNSDYAWAESWLTKVDVPQDIEDACAILKDTAIIQEVLKSCLK